MNRRDFLKATAGAAAGACSLAPGPLPSLAHRDPAAPPRAFDDHFTDILDGYLRNLEKTTASSFAVCDFPEGTMLKSCLTPSGKTYVSTARMLPAMAEYVAAGREPRAFAVRGQELPLADLLLRTFRDAFDPAHEHYWGEPRRTSRRSGRSSRPSSRSPCTASARRSCRGSPRRSGPTSTAGSPSDATVRSVAHAREESLI